MSARTRTIWTFVVTTAALFIAQLDTLVVTTALPAIREHLHASLSSLEWTVNAYTLTFAVLLMTGATLGERFGRRRMLVIGLAVFTLGSIGAALAPSATALIAARAIQGVGAAAMVPQVLSIIQRNFAGPARLRATSMFTAVLAGGAAAGQVIGGLLISADIAGSTWRPAFLVNVPVGIAAFFISGRVLPKDRGEPGRGLDPVGVGVLTPTVLAFVLPLVLGHDEHWPVWGWVLLALSVVGVIVFSRVETLVARRGSTPVIPGRILRLPRFSLSIGLLFVAMAVMTGGFFALTLHLQGALGFSALDAGLAGAPGAVCIFLISIWWRKLPPSTYSWLIVGGFVLVAVTSFGLAGVLHTGTTGGLARWVLQSLNAAGLGLAYSPLLGTMLARIPIGDAADASGVISTTTQLAQVTGVATFGTLFLNLLAQPGLHTSAHAIAVMMIVTGSVALLGGALAIRLTRTR